MIKGFIKKFTREKLGSIVKLHKFYYLINDEILAVNEKIDYDPEYIGVFLGEDGAPSLALLELLAKHSDKKVFINDKSEYLFLCGRDIFGKGITKANFDERHELVLVQNEKDENLGYGKIVDSFNKKEKIVINNILDRGDFLRREK